MTAFMIQPAELNSYSRDCMVHKASNIYDLALNLKILTLVIWIINTIAIQNEGRQHYLVRNVWALTQ